ncbi:MAG TPA: hypothetical protein VGB50_00780 [Flavobacterium sp.]|jgi:hypothetical protein
MKKITTTLLIVFCFVAFSCSNDDNNGSAAGDLTVTGKVMAPNNSFPISRATVKVFQDDELIATKVSDALGVFEVNDLPDGELTIQLSKGKFKKSFEIDLQDDYELLPAQRNLDEFPEIVVVQGAFDAIEEILFEIGIVDPVTGAPAFDIVANAGRMSSAANGVHGPKGSDARMSTMEPNVAFTANDLLHDTTLLNSYDIIFLNCGGPQVLDPVAAANLKAFVNDGGIVYATDWAFSYINTAFAEDNYLTFAIPNYGGTSTIAEVTINDPDLLAWLDNQGIDVLPSVTIEGFIGGWQMVESFNDSTVDAWLPATTVDYGGGVFTNKALAYTFQHGCGGVFYSSFHTHGNNSAQNEVQQMMNYFVFELSGLGEGCGASN